MNLLVAGLRTEAGLQLEAFRYPTMSTDWGVVAQSDRMRPSDNLLNVGVQKTSSTLFRRGLDIECSASWASHIILVRRRRRGLQTCNIGRRPGFSGSRMVWRAHDEMQGLNSRKRKIALCQEEGAAIRPVVCDAHLADVKVKVTVKSVVL